MREMDGEEGFLGEVNEIGEDGGDNKVNGGGGKKDLKRRESLEMYKEKMIGKIRKGDGDEKGGLIENRDDGVGRGRKKKEKSMRRKDLIKEMKIGNEDGYGRLNMEFGKGEDREENDLGEIGDWEKGKRDGEEDRLRKEKENKGKKIEEEIEEEDEGNVEEKLEIGDRNKEKRNEVRKRNERDGDRDKKECGDRKDGDEDSKKGEERKESKIVEDEGEIEVNGFKIWEMRREFKVKGRIG